ncbi:MAG: hypothetical protein ACPGUD_01060 [Parashewanella sp.]
MTRAVTCNKLTVFTLVFIAFSSLAQVPKSKIISIADPMIQHLSQDVNYDCLGISRSAFSQALSKGKNVCQSQLSNTIKQQDINRSLEQYTSCVTQQLQQHFDIAESKLERCDQQADDYTTSMRASEATASPEDTSMRAADTTTNSEETSTSLSIELMTQINNAMKLHAEFSDIDDVTLPLYPDHHIVSHFPDGMKSVSAINGLPVTVIATDHFIENVIKFYERELHGFSKFPVEHGVIFMESAPKDFDLFRHFSLYLNTPHVLIEDMRPSKVARIEANTKIEISYRKD